MSALLPPALLLLWSGIAATALTGLVLAPAVGLSAGALAWNPVRASVPQGVLAGVVLLPVAYGIAFGLWHEANLFNGAFLGALHALVLALRSLAGGGRTLLAQNRDRLILCVAYGALIGFIHVTP